MPASGVYGVSGLHLCAGDKPGTFVGSKQWIGAIELGFILDTLLGVSCKVITVSSGADMPSKAREIAHHFDTQVLQLPHEPMLTLACQPACGSRAWQIP